MDRTLLSLKQAAASQRTQSGSGTSKRWPQPSGTEIKSLRERLGLSQSEFARRFGLDLGSLKHWEASRRTPEQGNCLLLKLIAYDPGGVARLVHKAQIEVDQNELELVD